MNRDFMVTLEVIWRKNYSLGGLFSRQVEYRYIVPPSVLEGYPRSQIQSGRMNRSLVSRVEFNATSTGKEGVYTILRRIQHYKKGSSNWIRYLSWRGLGCALAQASSLLEQVPLEREDLAALLGAQASSLSSIRT